ncbi:MAG: hypothetical protein ABJL99_24930 [Aliishimia sp.]
MLKYTVIAAALTMMTSAAQASVLNKLLSGKKSATAINVQMLYEKPAASFGGQHFTNSLGCVYSRTQAPGYPIVWHLQVNSRVPGCPNTVSGQ